MAVISRTGQPRGFLSGEIVCMPRNGIGYATLMDDEADPLTIVS
jgi:hypothetical protein